MNLEKSYTRVKEKGAAEPEDLEPAVTKVCDDVHTVWSSVSPQTAKDWTRKILQNQALISFDYIVSIPENSPHDDVKPHDHY